MSSEYSFTELPSAFVALWKECIDQGFADAVAAKKAFIDWRNKHPEQPLEWVRIPRVFPAEDVTPEVITLEPVVSKVQVKTKRTSPKRQARKRK